MSPKPLSLIVTIALVASAAPFAFGGDVLKITIPRRSELTPVQKLNQEGVEAVRKRDYEKASTLFYKAYLYDPADPFTLNNLGYISELQGELERARKFYALSAQQGSDANIAKSNAQQLVGKPMQTAFASLEDGPMRVNRMNVDAMNLLSDGRTFEAVNLLQKALILDPANPFTLNNLGVASESIGDFESALKYYGQASGGHSKEAAVVTPDRAWRGKAVSAMAASSANRLEQRLKKMDNSEQQSIKFTLRGVLASNQNNLAEARENFLQAYSIDPNSAFSLNNRGYVAELDGDLETAQYFYDKARRANDAAAKVGMATQHAAEGARLSRVASDSDKYVDSELEKYSEQRRQQTGPIELTPRDAAPAAQPNHQ